ncbi:hypothetical protein NTH44_003609 [Vibrio metoecus]|nr:hypothetical protein [Vibrio cholerae]
MSWNLHRYYSDRNIGLLGHLILSKEEDESLRTLRDTVRKRIKDVFEEANKLANELMVKQLNFNDIISKLGYTYLRHLSYSDKYEIAQLFQEMDVDTKIEFMQLEPRFGTQGSFQYKTHNRPYQNGQEIDIDDGTYLPMTFFESEPKVGHKMLTLLVDAALKSLVKENFDWHFESKRTCARIKIPKQKIHIDVPMYAIPRGKFVQKAIVSESCSTYQNSINSAFDSNEEAYEKIDSLHVNLALRDETPGSAKWMNSDPKVVEDWFKCECNRIGDHLKDVCRIFKAWRDAQWVEKGPTSISLMAAVVNILNKAPHDPRDFGSLIYIVADRLAQEFLNGIDSPDETDQKPLFPPAREHGDFEKTVIAKMKILPFILRDAEESDTKQSAIENLNKAFGTRVKDLSLINSRAAAPAFVSNPLKGETPQQISQTMISG